MQSNTEPSDELQIQQIEQLSAVGRDEWNQLVPDSNPFLLYDFLAGLERHHCLEGQGWQPCHLILKDRDKLVAALPLYLKDNSYGEFVFDWAWADAYERAGGQYYPKLVSAIPFSPVSGGRLLVHPDYSDQDMLRKHLAAGCLHFLDTNEFSSFHCLFPDNDAVTAFSKQNLLLRKTIQFHWHNQGYRDFQDFLDRMTSKKRKQIKRERRQVRDNNIDIEVLTGKEISEQQWNEFYQFYCTTFYRRWGNPRLTLDFFLSLSEKLPEQTLLIMASHEGNYVAGAFAMLSENTLYGRHWGCSEQFSNLHFELCYYQTIEFCIQQRLKTMDAGVQGEHKLNRGFEPVGMLSCHWLRHAGFREAIDDYLGQETAEVEKHIAMLKQHLPYKSAASTDDQPG